MLLYELFQILWPKSLTDLQWNGNTTTKQTTPSPSSPPSPPPHLQRHLPPVPPLSLRDKRLHTFHETGPGRLEYTGYAITRRWGGGWLGEEVRGAWVGEGKGGEEIGVQTASSFSASSDKWRVLCNTTTALQNSWTLELGHWSRALRASFSNEAVKKENGGRGNLVQTLAANYTNRKKKLTKKIRENNNNINLHKTRH